MPFQIVVHAEVDFANKDGGKRIELKEKLCGEIEAALDEALEELAEDDMMPVYMSVKSEES